MSNAEIMDRGISCLIEKLGTVDTERFISVIIRERFDYTKWQRKKFDNIDLDTLTDAAVKYEKEHPFKNNK